MSHLTLGTPAAKKARIPLISTAIITVAFTAPLVLAGTTPASAATVRPAPATVAPAAAPTHSMKVAAKRDRVLKVALSKKHARYVAGAAGPNQFDCSGFAMWVYKKAVGKSLPHYSGAQMQKTHRVARNHLLPGDLLFYGSHGSQHVSIYIGHGKQIAANNPSAGIQIDSINASWWRTIYAGAGRVIS